MIQSPILKVFRTCSLPGLSLGQHPKESEDTVGGILQRDIGRYDKKRMIRLIKSQIEAISDARWALIGNGSVHTAAGTQRSPRGGLLSMCRQTGSRCVCLRVRVCVVQPVHSASTGEAGWGMPHRPSAPSRHTLEICV